VGYFQADTGTINQLVHLWKFEDDADRRAHWAAVYANKDFVDVQGGVLTSAGA
jgi:NIPSNAP